jgi:hypothetical protein
VLGLGLAAVIFMYGVADTLMLKPAPYPDGDRLYTVVTHGGQANCHATSSRSASNGSNAATSTADCPSSRATTPPSRGGLNGSTREGDESARRV